MALYDEGRDDRRTRKARGCPRFAPATRRSRPGSRRPSSFTQPPPRYSEASLVKRLEELGIGRPSTYAATLQTLKDREYVRLDKNRFIPEESGRLVTAFLERFFERYVSFDYTAELEEELDDVSGGRLDWQKLLEDFWRDFKPKAGEVMDQKPSDVTAALDDFLSPYLFPDKGDGSDPRLCPLCGTGRLGLARRASSARSLPAPTIRTANIPAASARARKRPAKGRPRSATASSSRAGGSGPIWSATALAPRCPRTCRRTG